MNRIVEKHDNQQALDVILDIVDLSNKKEFDKAFLLFARSFPLRSYADEAINMLNKGYRLINSELQHKPLKLAFTFEKYPELDKDFQQEMSFDILPTKSTDLTDDTLVIVYLTPDGFLIENFKEYKALLVPKNRILLSILEYSDCIKILSIIFKEREKFFNNEVGEEYIMQSAFRRILWDKVQGTILETKEIGN